MAGLQPVEMAQWKKFGSTNRDRCEVCGGTAQIAISMFAHEKSTNGRGNGNKLAQTLHYFCDTHGQMKYGEALRRLQGAIELKG